MPTTDPRTVVEEYFECFARKEFTANRDRLAERFSFTGPIDSFDDREPFLEAVGRLAPVMKEARRKQVFVDGRDVSVLWDFVLAPTGEVVPISETFRVENGKITRICLIFDPRSLLALAGG